MSDVQKLARSAGCSVVSVGDEMHDGILYPAYEITCADNQVAIVFLNLLAIDDSLESLTVQGLASAYRAFAMKAAGGSGNWRRVFAEQLQGAMKNMRYVEDEYQTFRAPEVTMGSGQGNCVNQSRIVAAVARAAGVRARVAPVYDGGEITHACAQLDVTGHGQMAWAETTIDARLGEEPLMAARRLGLRGPLVAMKNRRVRT